MTRRLGWSARVGLVALCWGMASKGAAQTTPATAPVVRLSTAVFGGWDQSLTPSQGLVTAPSRRELMYGGANASLLYRKGFEDMTFTAAGSASTRYAPALDGLVRGVYGVAMTLASSSTRRWSWTVSQGLSYGQRNATALFAGGGLSVRSVLYGLPDNAIDAQLDDSRQLSSTSAATLGFGLSRRDRIQLGIGANALLNDTDTRRYLRASATVGYTRQLSRYAGLRAGYSYFENIRLQDAAPVRPGASSIGTADVGLSYARPLPFSRETTIAMSTGIAGSPQPGGWRYRAVGDLTIARRLGRMWAASVSGARSIRYVPVFIEPTLTDTVSASVGGPLTRRLATTWSANYVTGQAGFSGPRTTFDAYNASLQVRYAMFRRVGLYSEYYYFAAEIGDGAAEGLPDGRRARHGVRVGLSFGTELLGGRR